MKKSKLISLAIFVITFLLPFRYAVLDVEADAHGLSTFGVFFTGVGFIAGFYFLLKDDKDKSHESHENSHH
jgi:hypothetical protein